MELKEPTPERELPPFKFREIILTPLNLETSLLSDGVIAIAIGLSNKYFTNFGKVTAKIPNCVFEILDGKLPIKYSITKSMCAFPANGSLFM
jgi:hypothetical protein